MDRTKTIYIVAEIASLCAALVWWQSIIAAAMLSLAYGMLTRSRSKGNDHALLAFARELSSSCSRKGLNAALEEASRIPSAPKDFRRLSRKVRLGQTEFEGVKDQDDANLSELMEIVMIGIRYGTNIKRNLSVFISRLESEIDSRNRELQNSFNMDTLSRIGVSFFVPLFGGVGASIIAASGSITGSDPAAAVRSFEAVVIIYIAVMSYVMALFRRNAKGFPFIDAFQTAIIGTAIIRTVSAVVTYAI